MELSFIHRADALTICVIVFVGMIIFFMFGRYISKFFPKEDNESKPGLSTLSASLFGLFGFILAFTFGISGHRYESVRDIFIEECEKIGTATLRSDLYSDSVRLAFREDFSDYLEARIGLYSDAGDSVITNKSKSAGALAAGRLWQRAAQQSKGPNMLIPSNNMVTALNNMFDIATKRDLTLRTTIPDPIIYMLFILAFVSSFTAGVTSTAVRRKDWIIIICYVLFSTLIIYITLDLGRPLRGLIKAKTAEQAIVELRQMFVEKR